VVAPGARARVELVGARQLTVEDMPLPVHVIHGRADGPRLFLSGAIHGDELIGVEVIRRILGMKAVNRCAGTLVAIPVVNVHGFRQLSRYLPDRRDLNRSFPGTAGGSLAARLAHRFTEEIVRRCTHGIDIHTGAWHRDNLPQVRADLSDPETERLARSFGVPVIIDARVRDGSLRETAAAHGVKSLLFEGGEALRLDEVVIRTAVRGVLGVMAALGMLPDRLRARSVGEPFVSSGSRWVRAPVSGLMRMRVRLGQRVRKDQVVGHLVDPDGTQRVEVRSHLDGIVIGLTRLPVLLEGDAVAHVATFDRPAEVARRVVKLAEELDPEVGRGPSGVLPIV
jgi:predicted deacylase